MSGVESGDPPPTDGQQAVAESLTGKTGGKKKIAATDLCLVVQAVAAAVLEGVWRDM